MSNDGRAAAADVLRHTQARALDLVGPGAAAQQQRYDTWSKYHALLLLRKLGKRTSVQFIVTG